MNEIRRKCKVKITMEKLSSNNGAVSIKDMVKRLCGNIPFSEEWLQNILGTRNLNGVECLFIEGRIIEFIIDANSVFEQLGIRLTIKNMSKYNSYDATKLSPKEESDLGRLYIVNYMKVGTKVYNCTGNSLDKYRSCQVEMNSLRNHFCHIIGSRNNFKRLCKLKYDTLLIDLLKYLELIAFMVNHLDPSISEMDILSELTMKYKLIKIYIEKVGR